MGVGGERCRSVRVPFAVALAGALALSLAACRETYRRVELEASVRPVAPHPAIRPYVDFLRAGVEEPVAYVSELLDEHELVILCERAHPEATQYDFYLALLEDERVGGRIDTVFTELGSRNLQPALDELLLDQSMGEEEARRRLLRLYRDLTFWPTWANTNFFDFLSGVRELNRSRRADRRHRVVFSDVEFTWEGLDREGYRTFREALAARDLAIAERIVGQLRAAGPASKALAIMNFRHAFNDFAFDDGSKGDNAGRYLFEALPGKVANVMMNALAVGPGTTDQNVILAPIQQGKWDAAFRSAGLEEAGFGFRGSPFGADQFDYFPFRTQAVTYEDVFDGFVFFRPLAEHVFRSPVPGFLDEDSLAELRRRLAIADLELTDADLAELAAASPAETTYETLDDIEARIARWIE